MLLLDVFCTLVPLDSILVVLLETILAFLLETETGWKRWFNMGGVYICNYLFDSCIRFSIKFEFTILWNGSWIFSNSIIDFMNLAYLLLFWICSICPFESFWAQSPSYVTPVQMFSAILANWNPFTPTGQ